MGEPSRMSQSLKKPASAEDFSRRELHLLAIHGLRQATLVAIVTMPFGWVTEWLLRDLGFGAEDLGLAALRVGALVAIMLCAHLYVRTRKDAIRHPFVIGTGLMWAVAALGGASAVATGGFDSPYQVAAVPILVIWTLLMPGGYRYALLPLGGGVVVYMSALLMWAPPPHTLGTAIATSFFQVASMVVAIIFCEILERWRARVALASYTDSLTGLMTRGYLFLRLEQLVAKRRRTQASVAVVIVDLDHFKRVNDTYGHHVGDVVLRMVADVLRASTRTEDLCGRLGGEELLLVLDECDEAQALLVANRVREQVERTPAVVAGTTVRITLSAGVAVAPPGELDNADALIRAADDALYKCKDAGRNQVQVGALRPARS
jgi:diguanylate cyclase (GGDEF)-like protein